MKALLTIATTFLTIIFLISLLMTLNMKQAGGGTEGEGFTSLSAIVTGITGLLTAASWYFLRKINKEE